MRTLAPDVDVRDGAAEAMTVRRPAPVKLWATLGAVAVVVQAWAYIAWFATGEATPTPTGVDPVPTATKVWAWTLQIVMVVGAVAIVGWAVRKCLRERRLVFDGILVIVWVLQFVWDPVINYLRPLFFYNSYLINLGVWVNHIPGWSSPNANLLPEPLVFIGGFYLAFGMGVTVFVSGIMRVAKRRWPQFGLVRLVAIAFTAIFVADFISEVVFVRAGLYAYPGAIRELTLWAGHTYQFPIYEPFFVAPNLTALATL
ncbi:MAG: spirocyclase AveC family protein, partial [Acidimicrobiia bacterium]